MWLFVIRRILNNRWMMLCLLAGFVIVVAMVSSVPTYTSGILQEMLIEDMESFQENKRAYPGTHVVTYDAATTYTDRVGKHQSYSQIIEQELLPSVKLPVLAQTKIHSANNMKAVAVNEADRTVDYSLLHLYSMEGLSDRVTLVSGRMYEPGLDENNCYEVVVSQTAYKNLGLTLDTPYWISSGEFDETPTLQLRIVGVVAQSDFDDPFWYHPLDSSHYMVNVFMDPGTFEDVYLQPTSGNIISSTTWYRALDYHKLSVHDLPQLLEALDGHKSLQNKTSNVVEYSFPIHSTLSQYEKRATELNRTLLLVLIPLFVMLALYIFMVSTLIIRSDENEIAQLRSRGSSSLQIFLIYLYQGLILSAASLIIGPPLGYLFCRVIGAANGFLEFVNRTALPLELHVTAYFYSVAALALFLLAMLIPAWRASHVGIVEHKRKRSRFADIPLWKKLFLDIICLAISIYGYTQYEQINQIMSMLENNSSAISLNPLLFIISSLFILGCALLFLRIYPWIIRLIFFLGRKWWQPSVYASLMEVGRSRGQEQFLMLFIILSIAVGLFNANAARTLNQNLEDRICYEIGADVTLAPHWASQTITINQPKVQISSVPVSEADAMAHAETRAQSSGTAENAITVTTYVKPPDESYMTLEGVESAARVFSSDYGMVRDTAGRYRWVDNVRLLGIEPVDFAHTGWFRDDLLPYHWYHYLNLIVDAPRAALLSRDIADAYDYKVGDSITISWKNENTAEKVGETTCTIYGIIDYWPTYDPAVHGGCVITNLSLLQTISIEPYQIWLNKEEGTTDAQILNALREQQLAASQIKYTDQALIALKNDPLLQGLNGMLTLSFIITMLITSIGFLIYWILSIQSRALQFGIFRAIGMSLRGVLGILFMEQLMISVVSILLAIVLGGISSEMFVPMLRLVFSSLTDAPPFLVIATRGDYLKIYAIIGIMLALGLGILSRIVMKLRIDQALKLGED